MRECIVDCRDGFFLPILGSLLPPPAWLFISTTDDVTSVLMGFFFLIAGRPFIVCTFFFVLNKFPSIVSFLILIFTIPDLSWWLLISWRAKRRNLIDTAVGVRTACDWGRISPRFENLQHFSAANRRTQICWRLLIVCQSRRCRDNSARCSSRPDRTSAKGHALQSAAPVEIKGNRRPDGIRSPLETVVDQVASRASYIPIFMYVYSI